MAENKDEGETEMSWTLAGNIKGTPGTPTDEIDGITPLTLGQAFVDVTFPSTQVSKNWVGIEHRVLNTVDPTPLNILTGAVTRRAKTGYTVQLTAEPDSSNYFLAWTIRPAPPISGGATTYEFSGPSKGHIGVAAAFIVRLPVGVTLGGETLTVTLDGGPSGTFSPTTVDITDDAPIASATFTPTAYGDHTLSVSNELGLIDPSDIVFKATAATYSLTGPSGGNIGDASLPFLVQLPAGAPLALPAIITPHVVGVTPPPPLFSPATVTLDTAAPSGTFVFLPPTAGTFELYCVNDSDLIDPAHLFYVAAAPAPHLLTGLISYWKCDEVSGAGATLADAHGTNVLNQSSGVVSTFPAKINNGLYLGGGAVYIHRASNSDLVVGSGDYTFSLWVYLNDVSGPKMIFGKTDYSTASDYVLHHQPTSGFEWSAGGSTAQVGAPVATGQWYHVLCWYDSSDGKARIRINDTTTYVAASSGAPSPTAFDFYLGIYYAPNNLNGNLDEIGFWKRLLTPEEMTALYNGGAGLPYSSFTT